MMKRLPIVALLVLMLVACTKDPKVEKVPIIIGTIEAIETSGVEDLLGTIYVVGGSDDESDYDQARVTVTVGTIFDDTLGSFSELIPGQQIKVYFEGPVAESYPVQGRAATIEAFDEQE